MTDITSLNEDERDLLAAEYVLGVLLSSERAAVDQAMATDTKLRRNVGIWSDRFFPLMAAVPAVAPPTYLFTRLQTAIGPEANDKYTTRKGLGWVAIAAAMILAAFLLWPQVPTETQIATLSGTGAQSPINVALGHEHGEILFDPILPVMVDRDYELWLVEPGSPPRSLGLLSRAGTGALGIAADALRDLTAPNALAISVEPIGGSPTGQPTGPVILSGPITVTGTRG
jgi:anti-sigma-K factor RskA